MQAQMRPLWRNRCWATMLCQSWLQPCCLCWSSSSTPSRGGKAGAAAPRTRSSGRTKQGPSSSSASSPLVRIAAACLRCPAACTLFTGWLGTFTAVHAARGVEQSGCTHKVSPTSRWVTTPSDLSEHTVHGPLLSACRCQPTTTSLLALWAWTCWQQVSRQQHGPSTLVSVVPRKAKTACHGMVLLSTQAF